MRVDYIQDTNSRLHELRTHMTGVLAQKLAEVGRVEAFIRQLDLMASQEVMIADSTPGSSGEHVLEPGPRSGQSQGQDIDGELQKAFEEGNREDETGQTQVGESTHKRPRGS